VAARDGAILGDVMARCQDWVLLLAVVAGGRVSTSAVQPAGEGKFITGTEAKMAPGNSWADLKSLTLKQAVSYCVGEVDRGAEKVLALLSGAMIGARTLAPGFLFLALGGCVSVSPALPTGDHSYMISVVSHAQWSEAIERGVVEANSFCASQGLKATITNSTTSGTDLMSSSKAQVWFICRETK